MGHKGHWGEYTGNAKWSKDHAHTKVTKGNYKASERDDAAHIDYLKRDIKDDQEFHVKDKDEKQTADEKHISKLAGDMKYDKEHHGSPAHGSGGYNDHDMGAKYWKAHKQTMHGRRVHGGPNMQSPAKAAKPDYLDFDGDGNKSEPMVEALDSPAKNKVEGLSHGQLQKKSDKGYKRHMEMHSSADDRIDPDRTNPIKHINKFMDKDHPHNKRADHDESIHSHKGKK